MRIAIRILIGAALLVGVALAVLAFTLPSLVRSDAVRGRIERAAREATGREVAYADLDVGLLPPRLVVTETRVAGAGPDASPFLAGADVELRLALAPLLARVVVVDSLMVEGATLRLVRTADGIELPIAESADGSEPKAGDADEEAAVQLAVREVGLRGVRIVLEDRSVSPVTTWDIQDVDATARGTTPEAPIAFEASASLASGGSLSADGEITLGGPFQVKVDLSELVLDPVAPYLQPGQRAAGRVSGSLATRADASGEPEAVAVDLTIREGDVSMDELALKGQLRVRADLSGGLASPQGSFELDATQAALRYGAAFDKPPGTPATATGRIVTGADGSLGIRDTRVRIKNFEGRARVDTGARAAVALDAEPFELEGWDELLPALAETPLQGRVGIEGLELRTEPLEVRGRIGLEGLELPLSEGPPARLDGALVGEGDAVRGQSLALTAAGQRIPLELALTNLAATVPRFRLKAREDGLDTNALVSTLAGRRDLLSGPLDLDLDLRGPLGGDAELLDAISGRLRLSITPGQLRGVSFLRSTFGGIGTVGEAGLLYARLKGAELERFYEDEFEELSGTLELARGYATSNDLKLIYRAYRVDLRGRVGLSDMSLDLSGKLTLDQDVQQAIDGETVRSGGRVIPLASVTGTVDDPKVTLSNEAVRELAASQVLQDKRVEKFSDELDEKYGEGTGDAAKELLKGIFGRGRRR